MFWTENDITVVWFSVWSSWTFTLRFFVFLCIFREELEQKYSNKISNSISGPVFEVVSKVLNTICQRKITVPAQNSFKRYVLVFRATYFDKFTSMWRKDEKGQKIALILLLNFLKVMVCLIWHALLLMRVFRDNRFCELAF